MRTMLETADFPQLPRPGKQKLSQRLERITIASYPQMKPSSSGEAAQKQAEEQDDDDKVAKTQEQDDSADKTRKEETQ